MSVIPYPGFLFAHTICELAGADVSTLNTGCLAFVENEDAYYRLTASASPSTPNGADVISVPGGPNTPGCTVLAGTTDDVRRWILTNIADAVGSTANAAAWYIDSVLGSDSNIGTDPALPLQTARELGKRWARGATFNTAPVIVTIQSTSLLTDDLIDVRRPVTAGQPIIFLGTRPAVFTTGTVTAVQQLTRATNLITTLTAGAFDFTTSVGKYIRMTSGASTGYWAKIISLGAGGVTTAITTPFVINAGYPTSETLTVKDSVAPLAVGTFEILNVGCIIPQTFTVDIPGSSEVWFFDVDIDGTALPVPLVASEFRSGITRFFRSSFIHADVIFPLSSDAGLAFNGSSTFGTQAPQPCAAVLSAGVFGVQMLASHARLGASSSSIIKNMLLDQDTVIDDAWDQPIGVNEYGYFGNVCINSTTASPLITVSGGEIQFKAAVYGLDNSGVVLHLGSFAKATYTNKALFTVALVAVDGTGVIDYTNGVLKDFTAANLPFVSNATASDSQAGFIADV